MNPSGPHDAPAVPVRSVSVTVIGGAPLIDAISTSFTLRKPTLLPSGEKNGVLAPSVPGTAIAWSWLRARIKSRDRGPPMYASRDPSGEMATRPDQGAPGAIASVESIARVDRTTCFAGAGRIQPQIAPAEIRMTSTITAYNTVLSRRLCSLPCGVEVVTDGVTDGVCGDTAGRLNAAARSSISASGSISSSCRTSS